MTSTKSKRDLESESPMSSAKRRKTESIELEESIPENSETPDEPSQKTRNLLLGDNRPQSEAYQHTTTKLNFYLAPLDILDPLKGISRQLDGILLTYVKEAKGILMGWANPQFTSDAVRVLDDSPFSHLQAIVETLIWRPQSAEVLEGRINHMGPSHIGLLIQGIFNASILRAQIPHGWEYAEDFESDEGHWTDASGKVLSIGQALRFTTTNIKKGSNVVNVEGSLLDLYPAKTETVIDQHDLMRVKEDKEARRARKLAKIARKAQKRKDREI